MTDAEKAQIRYTELLRQTAQFTGLAARGTNSLEGAQRKAAASSEALGKTMGDPGAGVEGCRDRTGTGGRCARPVARAVGEGAHATQELRERAAAIAAGLPIIGPQPVAPVTSGLIGAVPGQTGAAALRASLLGKGIIQTAAAPA